MPDPPPIRVRHTQRDSDAARGRRFCALTLRLAQFRTIVTLFPGSGSGQGHPWLYRQPRHSCWCPWGLTMATSRPDCRLPLRSSPSRRRALCATVVQILWRLTRVHVPRLACSCRSPSSSDPTRRRPAHTPRTSRPRKLPRRSRNRRAIPRKRSGSRKEESTRNPGINL